MESQIIDEVTEWESRGYSGGYAGLHRLADEDFTGAVTEGMGWLFMLNGRVVGVFDGSIEDFADADGTAYEAPHPSLPLLLAMKGTGGETRAKYYTEDTPLSQVDGTLSSGGFTGYVELSENVLSGDYYVVYHGGRSLACAFVGNSRKLLTGDEAFDRADDEVGIYEVVDVDVEVIEIPEASSVGATDETGGADSLGAAGVAGSTGSVDANGQDSTAVEATGAADPTADDTDAETGAVDADTDADAADADTDAVDADTDAVDAGADAADESTAPGGPGGGVDDGVGIGDRIGEAEPGSADAGDAAGRGDDADDP
ncbi:MAG: transcriptional regulator, partial [Haloferacaceae archaeon]